MHYFAILGGCGHVHPSEVVLVQVFFHHVIIVSDRVANSYSSSQEIFHEALLDDTASGSNRKGIFSGTVLRRTDMGEHLHQFRLHFELAVFQHRQPFCYQLGHGWENIISQVDQQRGSELGQGCQRTETLESLEGDSLGGKPQTLGEYLGRLEGGEYFDSCFELLI